MRCHGSRIETLECLKRKLCIGCQVPGCLQDIRVVYTYVASDWSGSQKNLNLRLQIHLALARVWPERSSEPIVLGSHFYILKTSLTTPKTDQDKRTRAKKSHNSLGDSILFPSEAKLDRPESN